MNQTNPLILDEKIWNVIDVIENHFNDLYGQIGNKKTIQKIKDLTEKNPFLIPSPPSVNSNQQKGLLRLAMVGSAERTLQGEVFYAIRKEENNLGGPGSAVLEMKVSEWHKKHRNIDCVISPDSPNFLDKSIFIELGHYSTIQSNHKKIVFEKIMKDFGASPCVWKNNLGPILHIMFVSHIGEFEPQTTCVTSSMRDWPRLPGYFVQNWPSQSKLGYSSYRIGNVKNLSDIHRHLTTSLAPYYIGHVEGCNETVILGEGSLVASGRVDRFYSWLPSNFVQTTPQTPLGNSIISYSSVSDVNCRSSQL